jgi:glycosyltransferase involved in cell wall biosynthesis
MAREDGRLQAYYALDVGPGDEDVGHVVQPRGIGWLKRYTPLRFSVSWRNYLFGDLFDRAVASRLEPTKTFMGFVGRSLHSFRRASALGAERLELVAANTHVDNLQRLHRLAARQSGIHDSWLNEAQRRKVLQEYGRADVIYVHSEYVRQTFIDGGVHPDKLQRMYLTPHARFVPPPECSDDGVFRIVYVGRIDATKGIVVLLDAFARLEVPRAELVLVGGWSSRAMRQRVEAYMEGDDRIRVAPGDPLPVLQSADVYVHPSYEDGFGYAPMEALACGVPAIVTEDTGMKEHICEGENGYVVPTGQSQAILERLLHIYRFGMACHPAKAITATDS